MVKTDAAAMRFQGMKYLPFKAGIICVATHQSGVASMIKAKKKSFQTHVN